MTDQQERLVRDVLETVRTIQNNDKGLDIVSSITYEIFRNEISQYRIMLSRYIGSSNEDRRADIIGVLKNNTNMSMVKIKMAVDKLDGYTPRVVAIVGGGKLQFIRKGLNELGIHPIIEVVR